MLTEMACPSDRMRLKDKIITNIAKAIKGIQEAVFFKSQAQVDDGPLVLRNNDRQCHKLCENLDHVFLHGLRHVTNGYWKVATEFTPKNAVREIERLQNVTTNLGRGRAWIFMSLNECLLESYIRCMSNNSKFLRKHYVKEALLLDQQQMSVLLTLTSGLECVEFRLEYDLPYLDLSAYPPRTRTASEVEEEEADHVSLRSMSSFSSRHNSETAVSTPESVKALTDSDTASVNSLDASGLRRNSTRISTISTDSGYPADLLSLHSNKQRSGTPTDTMSVSSHGSAGEPDRLTRLENIVAVTDDVEDGEGGGLEVIRLKGAKKGGGKRKKSKKKGVRQASPLTAQLSAPEGGPAGEYGAGDDVFMTRSMSECGTEWSLGETPPQGHIADGSLQDVSKSCDTAGYLSNGLTSPDSELGTSVTSNSEMVNADTRGRSLSQSTSKELERLAEETRDSLVTGFEQLNSTAATIRAKASSPLRPTEENQSTQSTSLSSPVTVPSPSFNCELYGDRDRLSPPVGHGFVPKDSEAVSAFCDTDSDSRPAAQPDAQEGLPQKKLSALEEMESKCAQLCRPMNVSDEFVESDFGMSATDVELEHQDAKKTSRDRMRETASTSQPDAVNALSDKPSPSVDAPPSTDADEEEVDFYSAPSRFVSQPAVVSETHTSGQLQDYVDYISGRHDNEVFDSRQLSPEDSASEGSGQGDLGEGKREYALRLDNNTKLQVMLEIFTHDDEEFVKMFVTREGHTEGEMKTLFVLVTNYCLYFLQQRASDRKFETELKIPLRDLSFISLSLNKQVVNIESSGPNRRKDRIWLTPGDHLLAQEILECLEEAVKKAIPPTQLTSRFSIGSDAPLQTIALRKYISRDCHCEEQEVEIEDYTLVFWEDTQTSRNKQVSTEREGTLLLRVNDPFKGHLWKPVFVVLRDSMLCVFASKSDNKPQQYVRLDGEQCVGCRLETSLDRPHCIEIILAKGGSWYLSAASFDEVSMWRQSLCLAVSEGVQDSTNLSCLPCVSVVTRQKLLLCHEDVQTKFCRTIASAKVEEVTSLTFDPEVNTYCIVEFESQELRVSSERWVMYFNSPHERDRFVSALSKVWQDVYQVGLAPGPLEDLPLQKHCQDQVMLLHKGLSLK